MGDAREGRCKSDYTQWTPEETKVLIELLVNCIKKGLCDHRGRMSRRMVETKILPVLNERFKSNKNYKHYQHRVKFLKNQYRNFVSLLRFDPKFTWNPLTKKFTAPEEVLKDYVKINPRYKHVCHDSFEEYESLQLIFRNETMRRRSTVQPSDSIDARIHEVGSSEHVKEDVDHADDSIDEIHGSTHCHEPQEQRGSLLLCAATTESDLLQRVSVELSSINAACERILGLMQRPEVEKKTDNNVWEAIKEVPNLKNSDRYRTLTLVLKLEMKDIFMNMSVEDRLGWIQCSI